jgi:hypothetical protein
MGLFGPKEPSGFWRAFHGWHKPRFSEVCASIDHDTQGNRMKIVLSIQMRHPG